MNSVVHFEMRYDDETRMTKFYEQVFNWQTKSLGAPKQPWVMLAPGTPAVAEYYKASELWPARSLERRAALFSRLSTPS